MSTNHRLDNIKSFDSKPYSQDECSRITPVFASSRGSFVRGTHTPSTGNFWAGCVLPRHCYILSVRIVNFLSRSIVSASDETDRPRDGRKYLSSPPVFNDFSLRTLGRANRASLGQGRIFPTFTRRRFLRPIIATSYRPLVIRLLAVLSPLVVVLKKPSNCRRYFRKKKYNHLLLHNQLVKRRL